MRKKIHHTFLLLFSLFVVLNNIQATETAVQVYEGFTGERISGAEVWVLEDPKGNMKFREINQLFEEKDQENKFSEEVGEWGHRDKYDFGLTTSTYWIAIEVANNDQNPRELLLEIVNSYLFDFKVHRILEDGSFISDSLMPEDGFHKRGRFLNHAGREHRNFHFSFNLESQETTTWLFKFAPTKHQLNFSFHVWDNEYRFTSQRDFEIRMLNGFFMLGILYLLILSFAITITRFHYFWFYVIYVALGLCFVYTDMGQSYRYIWPSHPGIQQVAGPIIANLYLIAGIFFFREYFKTNKFYRKTDAVMVVIILVGAAIIPLVLAMPNVKDVSYAHILFRFANVMYVSSCVLFFIILFSMLFRSQKYFSGLFLFGFSLHGLNIIASNLQTAGIVPGGSMGSLLSGIGYPLTFNTHVTLLLGMLLEMVVVFYIAIRRFTGIYKTNTQVLSDLAFQKEQNMNLLVMGIEQERERIARDIHDGLGVMLASVKMKLNLFQEKNLTKKVNQDELTAIMSDLDLSHKELRNIARNLMPKALYKVGLIAAVEELVYRIKLLDKDLDIQFYTNMEFSNTSRLTQLYLFRIIQEMLTNLVRHSQAKSASLQLIKDKDVLRMTMEDDGIGFDVSHALKEGNGLNNIKYRVDALNGRVFFDASPGAGSLISMEIPLRLIAIRPND